MTSAGLGQMLRVVVTDLTITLMYWLLVCGLNTLGARVSDTAFTTLLLILWAALFFALFFSNGQLFGWMKNSYTWSISTTLVTLIIVIPVVIASTHRPCFY